MNEEVPAVSTRPPRRKAAPTLLTLPAGEEILRAKCMKVGKITHSVKALVQTLEDFLTTHQSDSPRPVAIAAPQLGRSTHVFSYVPSLGSEPLTIIDPELVYEKKLRLVKEECLSIPSQKFLLKRGKIVKIKGMLVDGSVHTFKGHDTTAQLFLHELNHLDGIMIDTVGQRIK